MQVGHKNASSFASLEDVGVWHCVCLYIQAHRITPIFWIPTVMLQVLIYILETKEIGIQDVSTSFIA